MEEGMNRQIVLLRLVDSWKVKNPDLTFDVLLVMAKEYNQKHFIPPYPTRKVRSITKDGFEYGWRKAVERIGTKGRKKKNFYENKNKDESKKWLDLSEISGENGFTITEFTDLMISKYHFATMSDTSEIFYYENGAYLDNGEIIVKQICEYTIEKCDNELVKQVIEKVRRRTYHKREEFDNFKDGYLNFENCRLNPKTMATKNYSYEDLILTKFPIIYDKSKRCPIIMKFLKECLPNNHDRHSVLEHLASVLLPEMRLEKAYMNLGDGGNGKSTWFYVVECFLGKNNISSISIHDMIHDKFKRPELFGVIANIYSEIAKKEIKELDVFKLIISGDTITVDKKGKNPFQFNPIAKHFFSANKLPELEGETDAVFRRFDIIMWNQQFVQEEEGTSETTNIADLDLKNKLVTADELSGLLNIILKIRSQLEERGRLLYSKSIEKMRNTWLRESNTITKYCDHFEVADGWVMLVTDLIRFYRQLCMDILHESPEPVADVKKKVEKIIPVCVFARKRYNSSQNHMPVVENIRFKGELGPQIGYDSGIKKKKTTNTLDVLFKK